MESKPASCKDNGKIIDADRGEGTTLEAYKSTNRYIVSLGKCILCSKQINDLEANF